MPVDRPTFSENWYRVADLKLKLRPRVQVYRQDYRGQLWYVAQDLSSQQFFRFGEASYRFLGLLDGRRSVKQAWEICADQFGDEAPTQGEVIQLLGQLYSGNLLHGDLPPDAESMFERYRKRVRREVGRYMSNLLFVRVPLIDPERFLDRWVGLVSWIFGPVGLALWLVVIFLGVRALAGRTEDLVQSAGQILDPTNLVFLYACFAGLKALHELGHGFACKKFGRESQTGGEVHTIGIMFLVFMPVPYVDASSAWALRNKWHRAFIGAAGMYVELAVAAIAAMIWAQTASGTTLHAICYNVMFIASVSTVLFNGNPLIRFDGYYILSDLVEAPNLFQRSKDFVYYLIKKYLYGARKPRNTAQTDGERPWLIAYAVLSFLYRIVICVGILLFVADKLFGIGLVLGVVAVVTWVVVPLGKWFKYLATSDEIARTRPRAATVTAAAFGVPIALIGFVPMPDHGRATGVVEPQRLHYVHMRQSGFIDELLPSGTIVEPDGPALLRARNQELETELARLRTNRRLVRAQLDLAHTRETAQAQALRGQLEAIEEQIAETRERIGRLELRAPFRGQWVLAEDAAPDLHGAWVGAGQRVGQLIDMGDPVVRVAASQSLGPRVEQARAMNGRLRVELRVPGRAAVPLAAEIRRSPRSGQNQLPSPALGSLGGGDLRVRQDDRQGLETTEPFFEMLLEPGEPLNGLSPEDAPPLMSGQRVVARFELPPKPLAQQWFRDIRELIQRRFEI